jgi:hypothetical protein
VHRQGRRLGPPAPDGGEGAGAVRAYVPAQGLSGGPLGPGGYVTTVTPVACPSLEQTGANLDDPFGSAATTLTEQTKEEDKKDDEEQEEDSEPPVTCYKADSRARQMEDRGTSNLSPVGNWTPAPGCDSAARSAELLRPVVGSPRRHP